MERQEGSVAVDYSALRCPDCKGKLTGGDGLYCEICKVRYPVVDGIPVLFSERPHVVISAGLSQAWRLLGGSIPPHLDAAALRAWSQPGWIKAGMEFRLEPLSAGTLLSTETRVVATDPKTRRAFAAYWFVIRPGSSAIRREVLKVVARRAESSLKAR